MRVQGKHSSLRSNKRNWKLFRCSQGEEKEETHTSTVECSESLLCHRYRMPPKNEFLYLATVPVRHKV